jgi:hypothetical protein
VRRVFVAAHVTEAEFLKGLLANEGIEATLRDVESFSVLTGMPATQPSVWVNENDLERAEAFVNDFERGLQPSPGAAWHCTRCGETIEAQFDSCWKCGSNRPSAQEAHQAGSPNKRLQRTPLRFASGRR